MADLGLILFGGFEAVLPSGLRVSLPAKKAQALLAYCALRPGTHLRETLATLLWGDTQEERARNSLRQTLFILRTALAGNLSRILRTEADTIATKPMALDVDVWAFERLAAEGTPQALERAAVLYRGDLLEGFFVDEEAFEQWVMQERERLREMAIEVLAKLFRHHCVNGVTEAAIPTARRLLALDPLQEIMHRALMRLLAQTGRRESALRQYQICADLLRRELRVEPELETRQLREAISNGHPPGPASFPWRIAAENLSESVKPGAPEAASGSKNGASAHPQRKPPAWAGGWAEAYAQIVQAQQERERARQLREQVIENRALLQRALKENVEGLRAFKKLLLERPERRGSPPDHGGGEAPA